MTLYSMRENFLFDFRKFSFIVWYKIIRKNEKGKPVVRLGHKAMGLYEKRSPGCQMRFEHAIRPRFERKTYLGFFIGKEAKDSINDKI